MVDQLHYHNNDYSLSSPGWLAGDVSPHSKSVILCFSVVPGCGDRCAAVCHIGLLLLPRDEGKKRKEVLLTAGVLSVECSLGLYIIINTCYHFFFFFL